MISIFDYGAGNLRSVQNTLGAIGAEYELIRDAGALRRSTKVILPGVGHFGQMMRALDELDVRGALTEIIGAGVPFLGICLGLQALFTSSARIATTCRWCRRRRRFANMQFRTRRCSNWTTFRVSSFTPKNRAAWACAS